MTTSVVTLLLALIVGQLDYFALYSFIPEHGILVDAAIGYVLRMPLRTICSDVSGGGFTSDVTRINTCGGPQTEWVVTS